MERVSVREVPWTGAAKAIKAKPKSMEAAIKAAGLDWTVEQKPAGYWLHGKFHTPGHEDPEHYFNVREDTEKSLGVVTSRYTPVQNIEAFSFLSDVFGGELEFETAGEMMGGRRVWVLMKMPEPIEIGGDPVGQYAFISNSHDGKSSVTAAMTPIRIVSETMLTAAVREARECDAERVYTLRHLGDMGFKIQEARNVLGVAERYYGQMKDVGDRLASVKLTDYSVLQMNDLLIPVRNSHGARAVRNRTEAKEQIIFLYKHGTTKDGVNTRGNSASTVWNWYNAVAEYADWFRPERKAGGRFQRSIDDLDGIKDRAWMLSLDKANLKG